MDVDVALHDGYVLAGGSKKTVMKVETNIGVKRPDYLMMSPDVGTGRFRVRSLECKGTAPPPTRQPSWLARYTSSTESPWTDAFLPDSP